MDILGPDIEVLWYLKDAAKLSWNTSQDYMYDKFSSDTIQKLIVDSCIGYGPNNTFILTDIGEEIVMTPLKPKHEQNTLGKNYTQPDNSDHEDEAGDWLLSALIFGGALGHILRENEGVVVKLKNDMLKLSVIPKTDFGKVIVYNYNNQIHIVNCDQDLKDGQLIWMEHENN